LAVRLAYRHVYMRPSGELAPLARSLLSVEPASRRHALAGKPQSSPPRPEAVHLLIDDNFLGCLPTVHPARRASVVAVVAGMGDASDRAIR
jgi:hypothetical protein